MQGRRKQRASAVSEHEGKRKRGSREAALRSSAEASRSSDVGLCRLYAIRYVVTQGGAVNPSGVRNYSED